MTFKTSLTSSFPSFPLLSVSPSSLPFQMTRGNQRELAREKAAKKQKEQSKKKGASATDGNKGLTLEQRKQRDADIMREKQEKKAAAAAAKGGGGK